MTAADAKDVVRTTLAFIEPFYLLKTVTVILNFAGDGLRDSNFDETSSLKRTERGS
jgi:hypothetical protein